MSGPFQIQDYKLEGYNFVIKIPVQFRDIDGMGHANNVAYFAFVETARIEYFIQLMNLQQVTEDIKKLPIILGGQRINYRAPAFYRDNLYIGMRTHWIKRSSFGFEFVMYDEDTGHLVADGDGTHIMYDYTEDHSIPVPDEWIAFLEEFEGRKLKP